MSLPLFPKYLNLKATVEGAYSRLFVDGATGDLVLSAAQAVNVPVPLLVYDKVSADIDVADKFASLTTDIATAVSNVTAGFEDVSTRIVILLSRQQLTAPQAQLQPIIRLQSHRKHRHVMPLSLANHRRSRQLIPQPYPRLNPIRQRHTMQQSQRHRQQHQPLQTIMGHDSPQSRHTLPPRAERLK
jgi:hypothetical protein